VSAVATADAYELRGAMVDQLKKRGLEFDALIEVRRRSFTFAFRAPMTAS
jgi:hypothetical protein